MQDLQKHCLLKLLLSSLSQQKTNAQKVFSETKIFINFKNQKK